MYQHGIGIEHEILFRFNNKINPNDFVKDNIDKYSNYLFLNSEYLINLFIESVKIIISNCDIKYAVNKKQKIFIEEYKIYKNIILYAINKKKFPKKYIIKNNKNKNYKFYNNLFNKYIEYYNFYHYPLMYFNIKFNNKQINNKILYSSSTKELKRYYNGIIYKNYKKELKKYENICNITYITNENIYFYNINNKTKYKYNDIVNKILYYINILKKKENYIKYSSYKISKNEFNILYNVLINNNFIHTNYSSFKSLIEFKTYKYRNVNYYDSLKELNSYEKMFIKIVNDNACLENYIKKYGNIVYHNTGSTGYTILLNNNIIDVVKMEDYTGSFHVWITPYYKKNTSAEDYVKILYRLSNKIQLLEPLFASQFSSPSIFAIGNNLKHSRLSLRHMINRFSGYGGSDIDLLKGNLNTWIDEYYYQNNIKNPIYLNKYNNIYDDNNNIIKNYNLLTSRFFTNCIFNNITQSYFDLCTNKNKINNYYNIIYDKYNLNHNNSIYIGADIRTRELNNLFYKTPNKGYKQIIIYKNNKFYKKYIKNNKIVKPKYDIKSYNKLLLKDRIGIEIRFFDHIPTMEMKQFLSILSPLMYQSTFEENNSKTYSKEQFWHNEMSNVILNGFEYKISKKYRNIINSELNINIRYNNTEDVLYDIYQQLNNKYINKHLYKDIKIKINKEEFKNFNKISWINSFNYYLEKHIDIKQKIIKSELTYNNIKKIFGKKFSHDLHKIMYYFRLFNLT